MDRHDRERDGQILSAIVGTKIGQKCEWGYKILLLVEGISQWQLI